MYFRRSQESQKKCVSVEQQLLPGRLGISRLLPADRRRSDVSVSHSLCPGLSLSTTELLTMNRPMTHPWHCFTLNSGGKTLLPLPFLPVYWERGRTKQKTLASKTLIITFRSCLEVLLRLTNHLWEKKCSRINKCRFSVCLINVAAASPLSPLRHFQCVRLMVQQFRPRLVWLWNPSTNAAVTHQALVVGTNRLMAGGGLRSELEGVGRRLFQL